MITPPSNPPPVPLPPLPDPEPEPEPPKRLVAVFNTVPTRPPEFPVDIPLVEDDIELAPLEVKLCPLIWFIELELDDRDDEEEAKFDLAEVLLASYIEF